MKSFIKLMSLMLSLLMVVSIVIACAGNDDEKLDPITTGRYVITEITTTAGTDTTTDEPSTDTTTVNDNATTTDDGFGPLIPLVTDKKQ